MIKGIYIINHKSTQEFVVYGSYDEMIGNVEEGDYVYEIKEAFIAKTSGIKLEELPQKDFVIAKHNYA